MSDAKAAPPDRTASLAQAITLMARLRAPDGCPWDREQTFDSIKCHTLEETYEVFDAIDRRAWPELKDEVGDLLLQVLFYAQMADEAGYFSIEDVAATLNAKLIRRHPHVFAGEVADTSADVKAKWESIKRAEKSQSPPVTEQFLDSVSTHMPAFLEAAKLGKRAAEVGFDWTNPHQLLLKLDEEACELREEIERPDASPVAIEDELGDLLFTAVNLARHLGLQPEFALQRANRKFRARFDRMEAVAGSIEALRTATSHELDSMWRAAKQALSAAEVVPPAAGESLPDSSSSLPD